MVDHGHAGMGDQIDPDEVGKREVDRHGQRTIGFSRLQPCPDLCRVHAAGGRHRRHQDKAEAMHGGG